MSSSKREKLTRFTRTLVNVPGFWRVTKLLERCFPVNVSPNDESRFVTIDNYDGDLKLRIDVLSYMGSCVYWQGYYSREELLALERILRPNMTFVDIGANNGYFTLFAAKRLTEGIVLSFEPVPETFENLEHNVNLNGFKNVRLFSVGLSNVRNDSVQIFSSSDDLQDALATVFPDDERSKPIATIKLERMDTLLKNENVTKVDLIKIDIEGGELSALKGAGGILVRDSPDLMVEFNAKTYALAGYSIRDMTEFLSDFGYSFFSIGKHGSLKETSWNEVPDFVNMLCSKKPIKELR